MSPATPEFDEQSGVEYTHVISAIRLEGVLLPAVGDALE
jgi:hypothetical protein